MRHFAVSAIGRDRPGIVAAVAERLLGHELNIEDSRMAILRGRFTMMLVVSAPDSIDESALRADLEAVGSELALEAISMDAVAEIDVPAGAEPSHLVTVYGADHPGIVAAVSAVLAAHQANITDLVTRLLGEEDAPLYVMMIEIALPSGTEVAALERSLVAMAGDQGVEIALRAVEAETL